MTRQILALIAVFIAWGFSCLAAGAPPTFPDLFGTWKVERLVGSASISASEKSARAALGTTVTISASLIKTYDRYDDCVPRNSTIIEADTEEKLESEFSTKREWLALPKSELKSRLPLLQAWCTFALVLNHDTLLWPTGNGYIYTLKRQHR